MSEQIIDRYDQEYGLYELFTSKVQELVTELISQQEIVVHSITGRVKKRESLLNKLSKPGVNYSSLSDITDISGLRITTYFSDQVDEVAKIVEREFQIDRESSIDRRVYDDPERFGYVSIHLIAMLNDYRCALPALPRYSNHIPVRKIPNLI